MAGINDLFKKYYDQLDPVRQTLSGMASNAQNALKNPVKAISELPEQVRAGRQLVQQHVSPVLAQQAQNIVNRIPAPVMQQMLPIVPPEMSRKVLGMGAAGLVDQPESYLRGAELILSPERRKEVSQMDMMGKLQAGGDALNYVPMGTLAKQLPKAVAGIDMAQGILGQAGKIKLGPTIGKGKKLVKSAVDAADSSSRTGKNMVAQLAQEMEVGRSGNPLEEMIQTPRVSPVPEVRDPFVSLKDDLRRMRGVPASQQPIGSSKTGSLAKSIQRPPQTLNTNNLDLNSTQKAHIQELQGNEIRQKLGDQEVIRLAKSAGFDTKTYTIDQTANKIAEQLNTRKQVVELENQFTQMKQAGASPEDMENIVRQIAQKARETTSQGTDLARQLRARRIMAEEISTPMQKIFKLLDTAGVNPDEYTKEAAKVDFNNAKEVVDFYRKYVSPSKGEWVDALRYNSMLSSPKTHLANIFSNAVNVAVVAPVTKTVSGIVDFIGSGIIKGKQRQNFTGEGAAFAKGALTNLNKAIHRAADSWSGKTLTGNLDYRHLPLPTTGFKGKLVSKLSYPTRILEATDQFFQALAEGGERAALGIKKSRGVNIADIGEAAKDNAKYWVFRGELKDPKQGYLLNGVDELTGTLMKLRSSKNPWVSVPAKFTLPFVMTPMNILKQGIEYSPAGLGTVPGAMNKSEQISKAIIGSAAMAGTMAMVSAGRSTWAEPTDEKKRAAFRAAGMQPYSIKVGDQWVAYNNLPPAISFPLAFVSAINDAVENKKITDDDLDVILSAVAKSGNFFADKSYLKNIGDLVSTAKGSPETMSRFISNYPQQLVPYRALLGWMARITDPYQRKVDTNGNLLEKQVQQLMMQLPFLSQQTPARTDQFGEPIPANNKEFNAFSPLNVTKEKPEEKEIYDLLQLKTRMTRDKDAVKESLERGVVPDSLKASASEETSMEPGFAGSIMNPQGAGSKLSAAQQMMHEQKISIIKDKLKYGGNITNAEMQLVLTPPPQITKTGEKELDKKLVSDYNSELTAKSTLVKEMYDAGVIDKSKAGQLINAFESNKIETTDEAKAKRSEQDAQYSLDSDMLKRSKDIAGWVSTTEEQIKSLEEYEGTLDNKTDKLRIQNRIADLKTQVAKYKGQGGFTKGKKGKKITLPKIKGVTLKIPKSKFKDATSNIKMVKRLGEQSYKIKRIKLKKKKLDLKTRK